MIYKKTLMAAMAASLLFGASAAMADAGKGQKFYLKMCKKCHGNGTKGAAMKTQDEWEELFEENGAMIIDAHKGTKGEALFNGDQFKKRAEHLKDFLYEYGSDSGNVPSC